MQLVPFNRDALKIFTEILGEPNERLSSERDLRFGSHGSLSIDTERLVYHDHEANEGGGILDLIRQRAGLQSRAEAAKWMKDRGVEPPGEPPATKVRKVGGRIITTYDYKDRQGKLVFQVVRFEPKTFRQRRPNGDGWSWTVKGVKPVPYRLPELLAAPSEAMVYVVEGEKDCDRLASMGLTATCNAGGAGKWTAEHAKFLKGRRAVILPDNDAAGREHARKVAKTLHGIAEVVVVVGLPGLPEKGDVSDWLDVGGTVGDLEDLVLGALATHTADGTGAKAIESMTDGDEEGRKPSQTDLLVGYVQRHFDLAHDENRDGLAIDKQTKEAFRLSSRAFRDDLLAGFFHEFEFAVRDASLREAMMTIQALARSTDEPRKANLRVAGGGDEYLIDLAKPGNARAIRLTLGHWEITERPRHLFVRGDSMMPQAEPVKGGDIDLLWRIANIPEGQRLLVLAWLVECLRPDTPYPLLELIGEQGSGKSITSEALRRLLDPNAANLRAEPKSAEDLFVIAHHNHVVALENVSRLTPQQQDAACVLATGGGFAKRKLYSDSDEAIIVLLRPVLINGIVAAITQQDLVDRCISIECPVLEGRLTSVEMWREFDHNLPRILGGLLDLAAKALALLPAANLPVRERPRLAEYAMLGCAVAMAQGRDQRDFLDSFSAMRAETVGRTLEASPVAVAVQELVQAHPSGMTAPLKDILVELERYKPVGTDAWPKSAKGLGDALRRAAPALRTLGVECRSLGKGSGGVVRWAIGKKVAETMSRMSHVPNPDPADELGHGTCGTLEPEVSFGAEAL